MLPSGWNIPGPGPSINEILESYRPSYAEFAASSSRSQRETSVASVAETSSSATTTTTSSSGRIEIVKTVDSSVTLQDFEWTNESIAKGAFGQTWKVVLIETDEQFALKTYNKKLLSKRTGNQQPSVAEQERIIFSKLSNPFISKLHWAFEDNKNMFLVLDHVKETLRSKLNKLDNQQISEERAIVHGAQIALALGHIHDTGYIHRDINPDNVFVGSDGYLKVSNFSKSISIGSEVSDSDHMKTTAAYTPPEVIRGEPPCVSNDWWMFGVTLYELRSGATPFKSSSCSAAATSSSTTTEDGRLMQSILSEQPRLDKLDSSNEYKMLILGLMQKDTTIRLQGAVVLGHACFASVDMTALAVKQLSLPPESPTNEPAKEQVSASKTTSSKSKRSKTNKQHHQQQQHHYHHQQQQHHYHHQQQQRRQQQQQQQQQQRQQHAAWNVGTEAAAFDRGALFPGGVISVGQRIDNPVDRLCQSAPILGGVVESIGNTLRAVNSLLSDKSIGEDSGGRISLSSAQLEQLQKSTSSLELVRDAIVSVATSTANASSGPQQRDPYAHVPEFETYSADSFDNSMS